MESRVDDGAGGEVATRYSFALLLAGQCVAAVAQPFFTNLATRVAGQWFPRNERDTATVIGSMLNPIGNAIGQV